MNFAMADALVRDHMRDVKQQVARCRAQPGQRHRARSARLRSRVGLRLVEAGLYLLADGSSRGTEPVAGTLGRG